MYGIFTPNLFERLSNKSSELHVSKDSVYRASVTRNIVQLLNSISLEDEIDFAGVEHARKSLLNFGVRPFYGEVFTGGKIDFVCKEIRSKILVFEPRVIPDTLDVSIIKNKQDPGRLNLFSLVVSAEIVNHPSNIDLLFKSRIDFDNTKVFISAE